MKKQNLISYHDNIEFNTLLSMKLKTFDLHKATLLFVEPYGAVISLLKQALSKHYNVIIFTADSDFRMISSAILDAVHLAIKIDTGNNHAVLQLTKILQTQCNINAVIPGFEYFVPIASTLSHHLDIPGIHPADVMKLRRKDLMRRTLKDAGLKIPAFCLIESEEDLAQGIEKIGFPAICKPVDAAGSVHVKKVNNPDEALIAARRILKGNDCLWGYKLRQSLLFEEYIEGKEYSLEGIIQNGIVHHYSFTEKFVSDQTEFIEIGHIVNAPIDAHLQKQIENYVENVIYILKADNCPFHAEIRLTAEKQPVLMEIAARLAGDRIGDLISYARNINYLDEVLETYLGNKIITKTLDTQLAGIRFFYRPQINSYLSIEGLELVKQWPIEEINFYYTPSQLIPDFPKPLRRLGHVIMKDSNYENLLHSLESIDASIVFK